jgi:hypothetical protein
MQKQYILNRKLDKINYHKQNNLLHHKIVRAKSLLNQKCPESFIFFKSKEFRKGLSKNKRN